MPTLDFNHSNTAPTAIPRASQTPSNAAPAAVALAAMAGSNTAPAAVALAGLTPDNTPPTGVPRESQSPSDTAPAAVALAGLTPDNTSPTGVPRASQTPSNTAPTAVAFGSTTGTASAPQPIAFAPIFTDPTDGNMHTASFQFAGQLTLDQLFGLYKAPANVVIRGVQLFARKAPEGAAAIIELVDSEGNSLDRTASLPENETIAAVVFDTPRPVVVGTIVRAKITQVGSIKPGAYLTATLFVQIV